MKYEDLRPGMKIKALIDDPANRLARRCFAADDVFDVYERGGDLFISCRLTAAGEDRHMLHRDSIVLGYFEEVKS